MRVVLKDTSNGEGEAASTMGRAGVTVRPPMVVERSIFISRVGGVWIVVLTIGGAAVAVRQRQEAGRI